MSDNVNPASGCTVEGLVMRETLPLTCVTCDYDLHSVRIKYGVSAITRCPRCGELNRLIVNGFNHHPHNAVNHQQEEVK